jgi:olefin beta-lactone synthetase
MNLVSLLEKHASAHPNRAALVDSIGGVDRVVSYQELLARVAAGADFLEGNGLSSGDTILVFQPVSIELYEILLAAFHMGIQVMMVDPSAGRDFLSLCCKRRKPDAFVGSWKAQWLRLVVPELRMLKKCVISTGPWFPGAVAWQAASGALPRVDVPDDTPALITFTSGSTGTPKAAVRTHGFLLAQHRALSRAMELEGGEVDLITLPVFVLANLASGLTSVLAATNLVKPGFPNTAAVLLQCQKFDVTRCAASPAFFEAFLKSRHGIPSFTKVYTGGAPVFPDLLRGLTDALPYAKIFSVFGSTEAEPIADILANYALKTVGLTKRGGGLCSGVPVPELKLQIIEDRWGSPLGPLDHKSFCHMLVSPGEAGEIIVSGDHVLDGYLDGMGDEETKIHVDGDVWHRTGDAGWLDSAGRIWLLGRAAEKLPPFTAGHGLPCDAFRYSFAVECALREDFPVVRMAAIDWKNRRTLIVGKKCGDDEANQIRCRAQEFGMEQVFHLDSLPLDRRHQAKIDYQALRECLRKLDLAMTSL